MFKKKLIIKLNRVRKKLKFFYFLYNMKNFLIKRKNTYKLTEKAFLNLDVEEKQSLNWEHRKLHLDIVTKNKKNKNVKKIINYLKNKDNFHIVLSNIRETDNSNLYAEPISHNTDFWSTGNNYFINCIIYEFKKNVVAYSDANKFISSSESHLNLYSRLYYESLESMNDDEIKIFLKNNPIEITNNAITGGKHRAYAMIGRIIRGKEYIPFYVEVG